MSQPRVLVVMRHAKAEPYADADRDRRLTARGRADATSAGERLAAWGVAPEHALISSATRTRETWELVKQSCGCRPEEQVTEELYAATATTLLEAIRNLPDEHRTAIVVGHNPATAYLASVLNDATGDQEAIRALLGGFPPAAVAVLRLPGAWADLEEATARLEHFHAP